MQGPVMHQLTRGWTLACSMPHTEIRGMGTEISLFLFPCLHQPRAFASCGGASLAGWQQLQATAVPQTTTFTAVPRTCIPKHARVQVPAVCV
jgi:hypothetical protein